MSRDPLYELGGRNIYSFLKNDNLNSLDKLGLCKVGDKKDASCEELVLDYTETPNLHEAKDALSEAIGDAETTAKLIAALAVAMAGGVSLELAIEVAADAIAEELVGGDAEDIAKKASKVLSDARGNFGGWYIYTRFKYKECVCCFGFTRWKENIRPWAEYKEGGIDNAGMYEIKVVSVAESKKVLKGTGASAICEVY